MAQNQQGIFFLKQKKVTLSLPVCLFLQVQNAEGGGPLTSSLSLCVFWDGWNMAKRRVKWAPLSPIEEEEEAKSKSRSQGSHNKPEINNNPGFLFLAVDDYVEPPYNRKLSDSMRSPITYPRIKNNSQKAQLPHNNDLNRLVTAYLSPSHQPITSRGDVRRCGEMSRASEHDRLVTAYLSPSRKQNTSLSAHLRCDAGTSAASQRDGRTVRHEGCTSSVRDLGRHPFSPQPETSTGNHLCHSRNVINPSSPRRPRPQGVDLTPQVLREIPSDVIPRVLWGHPRDSSPGLDNTLQRANLEAAWELDASLQRLNSTIQKFT